MAKQKVYETMASLVLAIQNCEMTNNAEWAARHFERLTVLVREYLPSGSGIDAGCVIDPTDCTPDKLIIHTSFHHMNEDGGYTGWTEHTVVVTPSLVFGCHIRVTGRDRNDIKNYLEELFYEALRTEVDSAKIDVMYKEGVES